MYLIQASSLHGYLLVHALLKEPSILALHALTLLLDCHGIFDGFEGLTHEPDHLLLVDGGDITGTKWVLIILVL